MYKANKGVVCCVDVSAVPRDSWDPDDVRDKTSEWWSLVSELQLLYLYSLFSVLCL